MSKHNRIPIACARVTLATVLLSVAIGTTAHAETSATIAASLSPDRLGALSALTFTMHYAGGALEVPSPVRRSVVQFPAGLSIAMTRLHSCNPARLRALGPRGCPRQSRLGSGYALAEVRVGSQTIAEAVTLSAFLGPPHNLRPTIEILGQGYTPYDKRVVLTGTVLADRFPYGEQMVMSIPPIPTVPLEPDASIVTFSLTVGARAHHSHTAGTVLLPADCPVGGFPFAARFTYADGSDGSALATAPCPAMTATAHVARTVSLNENGRLHLISKHGFTLNEQGPASGTITGTIYVHLTLVSTTRAKAEVDIHLRGGSITAYATAGYRRSSTTNSFSGSMTIARGTGSYSRVHGSGLSFSGTIQESRSDTITVHMGGTVSS
jgi:hypothetical protein